MSELEERADQSDMGPPPGPDSARAYQFNEGDWVLVARPVKESKTQTVWYGPCRIKAPITPYIYLVEDVLKQTTEEVHYGRIVFYEFAKQMTVEDVLPHIIKTTRRFERINKVKRGRLQIKWRGIRKMSWMTLEEARALDSRIVDAYKNFVNPGGDVASS